MDLYLLRHGEAGRHVPVASRDKERQLTAAGKEEVRQIGESLAEEGFEFDVVASSPLKRAKETAEIVNRSLGRKDKVQEWVELSPEGSKPELYRRLSGFKSDFSVLCVGHEPYMTAAIGQMISRGDRPQELWIVLKKGGLARVTISGFRPKVAGELRWLLTPKQIRKLS